jgi:hypothetical protein
MQRRGDRVGLLKRVIRKRVRQPLKRAACQRARQVSVECPKCHKRYANPLTHTCAVSTDFKRRKAAAARAEKRERERQRRRESAARRRETARARRKAAADRRRAAAAERRRKAREKRRAPARKPPARQAHDYRLCRDEECARHACRAYRDGITDCPLEHAR